MFGIKSEGDIRDRLTEWSCSYPSDGNHGGKGWCSDQLILYNTVKEQAPESIGLCPWTATIPRLCRNNPDEYIRWSQSLQEGLRDGKYVDFHMPAFDIYEDVIYRTLEAVVET